VEREWVVSGFVGTYGGLLCFALKEAACSGQDPEHRPLKMEYGSVGVSYDNPAA